MPFCGINFLWLKPQFEKLKRGFRCLPWELPIEPWIIQFGQSLSELQHLKVGTSRLTSCTPCKPDPCVDQASQITLLPQVFNIISPSIQPQFEKFKALWCSILWELLKGPSSINFARANFEKLDSQGSWSVGLQNPVFGAYLVLIRYRSPCIYHARITSLLFLPK